jgi:DNA-binding winged helix-turn-helix (wHTH) protein
VDDQSKATLLRFGAFELDLSAGRLLKNSRVVRLQPQPFKLLCLLTSRAGALVTREEIQTTLWKDDTFVDFEQGVNFAIKQVRDALSDKAEQPLYIETVPRRGYRFLAPVTGASSSAPDTATPPPAVDAHLVKALWENIAELRLAEARRRKQQKVLLIALAIAAALGVAFLVLR